MRLVFQQLKAILWCQKIIYKRWRQPVVVRKLNSLRTCITAWIAFAAQRPPWTWPEDVRSVSCKKNHHYRPHRDQSTSRGKMETAWLSSIVPEKVNLFLVWDFSHQRLSRTYGTIEVQEKHSYNYQQYHFASSSSSSSSPEWCWRSLRRNGRPSLTRVPGGPYHYDQDYAIVQWLSIGSLLVPMLQLYFRNCSKSSWSPRLQTF